MTEPGRILSEEEIKALSDAEIVKKVVEAGHFKSFSEMARHFYRNPSQFSRVAKGEQKLGNRQIREELECILNKSIPDGNGNGTCLECGKRTESAEYGYYGNRAARFYCRKHLKEYYAKLKGGGD